MTQFYDARETLAPDAREQALMAALPQALARACAHAPAVARQLRDCEPTSINSRATLATLPVVRKHELLAHQQAARAARRGVAPALSAPGDAFGGFSAIGWGAATRVFASPGPIYEPEGPRSDYWRFARALFAAGFRPGQLVHNCFSYHFSPAGAMLETAAHALGCTVFPGGTGQTEQQVQAMVDLAPAGYVGTPSFLKLLVDRAEELGVVLSWRHALVSGEAFTAGLREELASCGIAGYQAYGSADLGLIAYETVAREGLVLSEDIIIEIVQPGTGQLVPEGEVGEVVVTTLNPDYPLVRFGTGDLSAVLPGASPCGRSNTRIRGWMGRADQATKVRGLFVHPSQVADIARCHPDVLQARLVISAPAGADLMVLNVETWFTDETAFQLATRLTQTVRDVTKLRGEVVCVAPGTLPRDGKLIDDRRAIA
jgi:phenylacetate-CoA ligase